MNAPLRVKSDHYFGVAKRFHIVLRHQPSILLTVLGRAFRDSPRAPLFLSLCLFSLSRALFLCLSLFGAPSEVIQGGSTRMGVVPPTPPELNSKPSSLNPKPRTRNPKTQNPTPKPETRNPKPENPKLKNSRPKPETRDLEPKAARASSRKRGL